MSQCKKWIKLSQTALCRKWHAFSLWYMVCHKKGALNAFLLGDAYLLWQTDQPLGYSFATELILHLIHYLRRCEKSILSHQEKKRRRGALLALFHYKDVTGSLIALLVSERPGYTLMRGSSTATLWERHWYHWSWGLFLLKVSIKKQPL